MKKIALFTASAFLAGLVVSAAQAQSWPDKQITFVVPSCSQNTTTESAGSLSDLTTSSRMRVPLLPALMMSTEPLRRRLDPLRTNPHFSVHSWSK